MSERLHRGVAGTGLSEVISKRVSLEFEACDDGNDANDDACLNSASRALRRRRARPGRRVRRRQRRPTDTCNNCQPASCGDGVLQEERCDDGNDVETDACLSTCAPAVCGDGVVWEEREACDDGNAEQRWLHGRLCARCLRRRHHPRGPCAGRRGL